MSEHESDRPDPEEPERAGPRRLLRSRDDRIVGGVAGGLGRYFNVDPVFFRVGFVATAFLGGLGLFLYLAALLFVPSEDPSGGEPPRRSRATTIVGAVLLVILGSALLADVGFGFGAFGFSFAPLAFLFLLGAAVWWLVWGRARAPDSDARRTLTRVALVLLVLVGSAALFVASVGAAGLGGGVAVAVLLIALGALLVVAAVRGGARWLIVPALAVAAGLGLVAAADIDLRGGVGDRVYAPGSVAEIRDGYDLGAGRLEIDLRGVEFPAGDRKLDVELGFGEAVLVVPEGLCVVADADVGAGYLQVLGWDDGGFNVDWNDRPAGGSAARVLVDAHVGMGALHVVHDPRDAEWEDDRGWRGRHRDRDEDRPLGRSAAC